MNTLNKDFYTDIAGDESCFFDKKWELSLLEYTAFAIYLGQQVEYEFDLLWTGTKCLGFKEDGTCVDWTDSYKILRNDLDSFKRVNKAQ